jgi:hypothetical protein
MGMMKHMRMLPVLLVAMVALIVGVTGPEARTVKNQFAVTKIFFEFNSLRNLPPGGRQPHHRSQIHRNPPQR